MYRRIFIADQGLGARYVATRVKAMGAVPVVAVSTAEREQGWLSEFESVCIGPRAAEHSYLNGLALLQGALESRCTALHPGLNPLGNHPVFAALVAARGLALLGPAAGALECMTPDSVQRLARACGAECAQRFALRTWFDDGPTPRVRWPVTVEMSLPLARSLALSGRPALEAEHRQSLYPGLRERLELTSEVALRQLARRAYRLGVLDSAWLAERDEGHELGCIIAGDAFGAFRALPLGFSYTDPELDVCSIGPASALCATGELAPDLGERVARVLGVRGLCLVRCVVSDGNGLRERPLPKSMGLNQATPDAPENARTSHDPLSQDPWPHSTLPSDTAPASAVSRGRVTLRAVSGLSDPAALGIDILGGIDLVALSVALVRGVRLDDALSAASYPRHVGDAENSVAKGMMALVRQPAGRLTRIEGPRRCVLPECASPGAHHSEPEPSSDVLSRTGVQSLTWLTGEEASCGAEALKESYDGRLMLLAIAQKAAEESAASKLATALNHVVAENLSTNLEGLRLRSASIAKASVNRSASATTPADGHGSARDTLSGEKLGAFEDLSRRGVE